MNFSLKNISSLFSKKQHKYKSQDDLKNLSAPEIITLEPSDVSSKIDKAPSKHKLEGDRNRAMNRLLAIKRFEKEHPNIKHREKVIKSFLQEEGYDKEVNEKLVEIYKKDVLSRIEMKDLENRIRVLRNNSPLEYTESEKIYKQMREQSKSMKSKSKGGKTLKKNKHKNNKTRNR